MNYFIKQLFHILSNNSYVLFTSFIMVVYMLFHIPLVHKYNNSTNNVYTKHFEHSFTTHHSFLRHLNTNNTTISLSNNIKEFQFIKNISILAFHGKWTSLSIPNNTLIEKTGEASFSFQQHKRSNLISTITNATLPSFDFYFFLKDGDYRDHSFGGNFSLPLPANFSSSLESSLESNSSIVLTYPNISMTYFFLQYFDFINDNTVNQTNLTITLSPFPRTFISSNRQAHFAAWFTGCDVSITNLFHNISIHFHGGMNFSDKYSSQVLNYSIILSLLGVVHSLYGLRFVMKIHDNSQVGTDVDLITIFLQIIWDNLIGAVHVSLAYETQEYLYEFAIPAITYLLLSLAIHVKILESSWKQRNAELYYNNAQLFRKKLLRFTIQLFIAVFVCTEVVIFCYTSQLVICLLFVSTWAFQIVHSARHATKPPMNDLYIATFTISKLFVMGYVKGYAWNIYSIRPAYGKVALLGGVMVVEAFVLNVQRVLGGSAVVPGCLKQKPFDYYVKYEDVQGKGLECAICLDKFEGGIVQMVKGEETGKRKEKKKKGCLERLIEKFKKNNKESAYMRTPCNHYFHTDCLMKWCEEKNECPICRKRLPNIDE